MAVNLDGTFYAVRAALRYMVPARRGAIVTVTSSVGVSGAGPCYYAASKGGVRVFTRRSLGKSPRGEFE